MHREVGRKVMDRKILLAIIGLSFVVGAAIVLQPILAWLLILVILAVGMVQFPPYLIASAAVLAVVFSRLFVAWGIAPGFVNFFHFPLTLFATFLAMISRPTGLIYRRALSNRLILGTVVLAIFSVVSWLGSGGRPVRPILAWLLFAEPFLLIYAFVKTTPPGKARLLGRLAFGIALIQVPFAFWQALALGLGDPVQGTLVGQGAGAHVIGAIDLMAMLVLMAFLYSTHKFQRLLMLLAAMVLFSVPVLADAKQAIVAFAFGVLVLLWGYGGLNSRDLTVGALAAVFLVAAGYLYQPLRMAVDLDLILEGIGGKILSYKIIVEKMIDFPPTLILGLGPGHSVSRVALAASEGYVKSLPGGWLNLSLSPVTANILQTTAGFYLFAASSAWSGVSSLLGLFGDFGLLGLALYGWLLWTVWRGFRHTHSPWAYAGRAVLVMGVVLGAMFSWLETPEFALPWALYLATGLVGVGSEYPDKPQPLS